MTAMRHASDNTLGGFTAPPDVDLSYVLTTIEQLGGVTRRGADDLNRFWQPILRQLAIANQRLVEASREHYRIVHDDQLLAIAMITVATCDHIIRTILTVVEETAERRQ